MPGGRLAGIRDTLDGARVFLRRPRAGDLREWVALRRRNRQFLSWTETTPQRGADAFGPAAFRRMLRGAQAPRSRRFLVCDRVTGAMLGQVSLNDISRGPFQSCYLGYWIDQGHSRTGLMTEALSLTVRHAFLGMKLHRVEANILPDNAASLALVARLGFRREGVARRLLHIHGDWRDHERWALTVEDGLPVVERERPAGRA